MVGGWDFAGSASAPDCVPLGLSGTLIGRFERIVTIDELSRYPLRRSEIPSWRYAPEGLASRPHQPQIEITSLAPAAQGFFAGATRREVPELIVWNGATQHEALQYLGNLQR